MISGFTTAAIGVATVLAVAGCSAGPAADADPSETKPASPSAGSDRIVLAIAGDVHFTERTAKLLDDPATAFGPVSQTFSSADHAVVNLETAVTERGTPEPKQYHFKAPPAAFDAVKSAGIDMVSLANNHALDYGQEGFADTLDNAAKAEMPVLGAGRDLEAALTPQYVTIGDTTVAYLAVSGVSELADTWQATEKRPGIAHFAHGDLITDAVAEANASADVVVVIPHWGTEGQQCPDAQQKKWAQRLSEAGADAIVGTHAHLLQGMGWQGSTFVAYGTGNFVWWWDDAFSNDTGVVELTIEHQKLSAARFIPAHIDDTGRPIPAKNDQAQRIQQSVDDLRDCSGLAETRS